MASLKMLLALALAALASATARARPAALEAPASADQSAGVIPSPNQHYGDELDLQRTGAPAAPTPPGASTASLRDGAVQAAMSIEPPEQADASGEISVPVYVSPFKRAQRAAANSYEQRQESSHAPLNYAPIPAAMGTADLKTSASYGHHHHGGHHGGHHYDHSGWLDMGAWTGGKGAFGWYADYPVGGKHHGYGRR